MSFGFGMGFPRSFNAAGGPSLNFQFAGSTALDPRITFTRASTATYFNSVGVLTSAAIDAPRFDFNPTTLAARGLLIEEARTNSIRNNTMQGAVAGTPGTLPTNWVLVGSGLGTLTQTVVGAGTSGGISYIDIRLNGTTSTTSYGVGFESTIQISASVGQTWTSSFYVARVGGSTTNLTNIYNRVVDRDGAGTNLGSSQVDFLPTLTTTLTRVPITRTLAGVGTAAVSNDVLFAFNSGVAIDITLRIGLPQLELGAFATSVIPTTTTALTRSADVASVNTLSPWFNSTAGTLFTESLLTRQNATADNQTATIRNPANTSQIKLVYRASGATGQIVVDTSVNQADLTATGVISANTTVKMALAYAANDFAASGNGGAVVTDTSGTLPSGLDQMTLGQIGLNGYLRRITYYPRRLSNAELQAITA